VYCYNSRCVWIVVLFDRSSVHRTMACLRLTLARSALQTSTITLTRMCMLVHRGSAGATPRPNSKGLSLLLVRRLTFLGWTTTRLPQTQCTTSIWAWMCITWPQFCICWSLWCCLVWMGVGAYFKFGIVLEGNIFSHQISKCCTFLLYIYIYISPTHIDTHTYTYT